MPAIEQVHIRPALGINEQIFAWKKLRADAAVESYVIIRDDGAISGEARAGISAKTHFGVRLQPARVGNEITLPDEAGADDRSEAAQIIAGRVGFAPKIFVEIPDGRDRLETALGLESQLRIDVFVPKLLENGGRFLPAMLLHEQ